MATWKCECGYAKEGRCKPQKCEKCGEKGKFVKAEQLAATLRTHIHQNIKGVLSDTEGIPFCFAFDNWGHNTD